MCFTLYIYIIYINFVELYIRVDAFRLSKALLFPLPKNDKKLLCSIWDYHTPSWVPPSIGSPLAWSCELTWFQVPLLLCAAVQAQPLLSVWHTPKYRVWVHCFPCVRWQAFWALPSPKKQCRQRVKSEKTRWRNIYTHTCGYCYVFQIFGAKLIYFLVCSKLFVLKYINSREIFLLDENLSLPLHCL